ncbi:RsmD family RNA methyltransferase [uncultured Victivallis sp.]|uniref:RsmD family RNA methyltransferase n=1 Tax=uncultured Victivallis sp. TaxID=354118 RepID=UPI0025F1162C|nr:RsmD family RNA methyltransferase [uncultured Victivallis sp.]
MRIIAGTARNIELAVPPGIGVRPTAGRARKALFDSIGNRLAGGAVLDLCAGSGALALEAASRGAAAATLVEADPRHVRVIEENIARMEKAGVRCGFRVVNSHIETVASYAGLCGKPDVIFADPPYAESAELFRKLLADSHFTEFAAGALLIWEIPDMPGSVGLFLDTPLLAKQQLRKFGGTDFLLGEIVA